MTFDLLIGAGSALVLSMFWRKLATQHDAGGIVTRREALDRSVDGFKHPLENLDLVADPANNFKIIMKDGVIYKNTLAK